MVANRRERAGAERAGARQTTETARTADGARDLVGEVLAVAATCAGRPEALRAWVAGLVDEGRIDEAAAVRCERAVAGAMGAAFAARAFGPAPSIEPRRDTGAAAPGRRPPPFVQDMARRLTTIAPDRGARMKVDVAALATLLGDGDAAAGPAAARIFEHWARVDEQQAQSRVGLVAQGWIEDDPALRSQHVDHIVALARARDVWVARTLDVPVHADVLEGVWMRADEASQRRLRQAFAGADCGRGVALHAKRVDTMGTEVAALPGYMAAGAAGAARSAPLGLGDGVADALEARSVEYLETVGVRGDEAQQRAHLSATVGELGGAAVQTVAGATPAGGVAGRGWAGLGAVGSALKAADTVVDVIDRGAFVAAVYAWGQQYAGALGVLWEGLGEVVAAARAERPPDVLGKLLDRVQKEALSAIDGRLAPPASDGLRGAASRKERAWFVARVALRRIAVNLVREALKFVRRFVAGETRERDLGVALRSALPGMVEAVVVASWREVAADLLQAVTGLDDDTARFVVEAITNFLRARLAADGSKVLRAAR